MRVINPWFSSHGIQLYFQARANSLSDDNETRQTTHLKVGSLSFGGGSRGSRSPHAVSGVGPCRDGSLGGDATGEVQAGVPGGAYLPTRASLVLVHTTRVSEICFAPGRVPNRRSTARGAARGSRRGVTHRRDASFVPRTSSPSRPPVRARAYLPPPHAVPSPSRRPFSDPVRPRPKNHQRALSRRATTGSIRRQDQRHLAVHVRQVR